MRPNPLFIVLTLCWSAAWMQAADIILPQSRTAYYVSEPIEVAVVGLKNGEEVMLGVKPNDGKNTPIEMAVSSPSDTALVTLPAFTLAPGKYKLVIGKSVRKRITISRGVHSSTMYVSQTNSKPNNGANYHYTNAFTFGNFDNGAPTQKPRQMSGAMKGFDKTVSNDMPSLVYMYWTGYVLHKPWGSHKEWCSPDMTENMRLFNFHVAQRMRRYDENVLMIGAIDEPGLPWGKTPAGGAASGYPGWNTKEWYESRGWEYTNDPANRSDADWLKYCQIRADMLYTQTYQANKDIKEVWPSAVFSSDLYAPQAFGDGTDPWNQRANDVPSTHVFADWGYGKIGVLGGLYLEKAHDPLSKVAHAMNGQLFGARMGRPESRVAYHLMMNVLLAGGLKSNWWLNYNPLKKDDLIAVNEPAERIGPVFVEMNSNDHDTAILWSFTEIAMRCKDVTAREAKKAHGEQIKLMIADLPENAITDDGKMVVNAYTVGGNYKGEVLTTHTALGRAGYPAHIIHERLIPQGVLKNYKNLVIVGQTFPLPADTRKAIEEFAANGGQIVVDSGTTRSFPNAVTSKAVVKGQGYQWQSVFGLGNKEDAGDKTRDNSFYQTNFYMESFSRNAASGAKETFSATAAKPVFVGETVELTCERHVGGEGEMRMLINGFEKLGDVPATEKYPIWNHAVYQTSYTLPGLTKAHAVYLIEGLDWKKVSKVADPTAVQNASFEPGEMKLYLIAPREPSGLALAAKAEDGKLMLTASLQGVKMPWPLTVSVNDGAGTSLLTVYRATDGEGQYAEAIPLGRNAGNGPYQVSVSSPAGDLKATAAVEISANAPKLVATDDAVRAFSSDHIRAFLAAKPKLTIAVATPEHQAAADKLAKTLGEQGVDVAVRPEGEVWRKALYPRVWDPYITVFSPQDKDKAIPKAKEGEPKPGSDGKIVRHLTVVSESYDTPTATEDGKPVTGNWAMPGTLITVGKGGFIDTHGPEKFYSEGCKLYINERRRRVLINGKAEKVKSTAEVRAQWARPWQKLRGYVGAHNLIPQLPEAYASDEHLIVMGSSKDSELVRALQASELLLQVADEQYPGAGKALVSFAWSPFAVEKNVIVIAATDNAGVNAGAEFVGGLMK